MAWAEQGARVPSLPFTARKPEGYNRVSDGRRVVSDEVAWSLRTSMSMRELDFILSKSQQSNKHI